MDWLTRISENTAHLLSMVAALHRTEDGVLRGGYLYFPPGRYYLGAPAGSTFPRIVIPSNVTLWFEQGAVLVPVHLDPTSPNPFSEEQRVVLEIAGEIEAGLFQIFDPNLLPHNDTTREDEVLAGKVVFVGPRVRRVYPEWWGTLDLHSHNWPARNRRAFQAAIDAAHTDRLRPLRDAAGRLVMGPEGVQWRAEPTIPIVANGSYPIDHGLVVGRTASVPPTTDPLGRVNPAPFVLKGGADIGQHAKTLLAASTIPRPMLHLRGVSSFHIEGVGFDGDVKAQSCVRVEPGADGGIGTFERCTFQRVALVPNATLVTVSTPIGDGLGAITSDEPFHLAFTACRFTPLPTNYNPNARSDRPQEALVTYPAGLTGLLLDYSDRCTVELRTCHLQGPAEAMIRARRGHFSLNECAFHTLRREHGTAPAGTPGSQSNLAAWRAFWGTPNGTDIFLEAPAERAGERLAPASFTARECESQSYQFLATWQEDRSSEDSPLSACVMINVHHNTVANGVIGYGMTVPTAISFSGADPSYIPAQYARPSVVWLGAGQRGCHLVAMGCSFVSQYGLGPWPRGSGDLGCIRIGPSQRGTLHLLANTVRAQTEYEGGMRGAMPPPVEPMNFVHTDSGTTATGVARAPYFASYTPRR